jgi:hypothetical protein
MNALRARSCLVVLPWLVLSAVGGCATSEPAGTAGNSYPSPEAAVQSFVGALRTGDETRLEEMLAPLADDILSSGDAVADRADAERFLAAYDERNRIQTDGDEVSTLLVGEQDWPFPVPIIRSGKGYVFDAVTGREEVLNRRVGRNELSAEQVCLAIADAQREYVALRPTGGDLPEYAQKLVSDPSKKNGLYWPSGPGEPPSPLGSLIVSAAAEGYDGSRGADTRAYHGYRYRLLTAQGPHARGGRMDYLVNGRLIGGFGIVAYPAQYGNSGITTFITNHDGIVYQQDLGPDTQQIAERLTEFDPGPGWTATTTSSNDAELTRGD